MKPKLIEDITEAEDIIRECEVCYLSLVDDSGYPYVLPFNFGYFDRQIFFHSGKSGKKIDIIKSNPKACIAFSTAHKLHFRDEAVACSYTMFYKSVLVYGEIRFLEREEEKSDALNAIMANYTSKPFSYNRPSIVNVCIFKMDVQKFTARSYGY